MNPTEQATITNPGWRVQLAIHGAVRRDVRRLSAALTNAGAVVPESVRAYWNTTYEQLHEHHVFEDTAVWPLMGERLGERVDSLLDRNAAEHVAMAAAMDEFGRAVGTPSSDADAARVALEALGEAIDRHLAHEEADVLPLIPEAFTLDDIHFFQAESAKTNPAPAFLPWLLDDAPEADTAFLTAPMPDEVRAQLESSWMPRWRAVVGALPVGPLAPVSASS